MIIINFFLKLFFDECFLNCFEKKFLNIYIFDSIQGPNSCINEKYPNFNVLNNFEIKK